jgi:hypothetical protein
LFRHPLLGLDALLSYVGQLKVDNHPFFSLSLWS